MFFSFKNLIKNFFYFFIKKKSFSLNYLDKKMLTYLNYNNGYFIELGANNGIDQSNTLFFEKFKNWKGILIEPIPHKYLECLKNRSNKNSIYCNACVSFDYKNKFVEMMYSNLMTTALMEKYNSKQVNHAIIGKKFLDKFEKNFIFGARATTLNDLMVKSKSPKLIDLLSLDVEGTELSVLKGINYKMYSFKYILIETKQFNKIKNFLIKKNYLFLKKLSHHDYLFKINLNN
jgi:FkbM family methyltransferase